MDLASSSYPSLTVQSTGELGEHEVRNCNTKKAENNITAPMKLSFLLSPLLFTLFIVQGKTLQNNNSNQKNVYLQIPSIPWPELIKEACKGQD